MTKEASLQAAKIFNFADSAMSLWTFKKKNGGGFSAWSVPLAADLEIKVRQAAISSLGRLTEVEDYELLAQPNEASCLHVGQDETSFGQLLDLINTPPEEHVIRGVKDLANSAGYIVRFWTGAGSVYAVKKVGADWLAQKKKGAINAVIRANRLHLVEEPSLILSDRFDFFAVNGAILIAVKAAFESLLSYKLTYQNSFANLQNNPAFVEIFVDMAPLIAHVGTNTMHLRRMAVVEQKAHFADAQYMDRLRQVNAQKGWGITFDPQGKIIATEESLRVIMQVLLNHRLLSELSLDTFDVPSASHVPNP